MSVVSNLAAAALTFWFLWPDAAAKCFFAWAFVNVLLHLGRLGVWAAHRKRPSLDGNSQLHRLLRIGAVLTGATWGAVPLFLFPSSASGQTFVAFVLAGVSGSAVAGLAFDGWAAELFAIFTLVPLAAALWSVGSRACEIMAVLSIVYLIYLEAAAKRGERRFIQMINWRDDALENAKNLRRLAAFNAMRSQVNVVISNDDDEGRLFQDICDLAVQYGGFKLAWIGRPDASGRFEFLAASGETPYMEGLFITTDPNRPEGQGPTPHTWFEGRALFSGSIAATPRPKPWEERAQRFGLNATATLPIQRHGKTSEVLVVYHAETDVFDTELRHLLEDVATDISRGLARLASRRRELKLRAQLDGSRQFERSLFQQNAAGIYLLDQHRRILDVNPALCAMTGYERSELIGQTTELLHLESETFGEWTQRFKASIQGLTLDHDAVPFRRRDGSRGVARLMTASVTLPDGSPGVLISAIDITALQQAHEAMSYQARHDALTELPNRFVLDQFLPLAVARARSQNGVFAVCMIDLDDFKIINDTQGHDAGDRLLKELAIRMTKHVRASDIVARLGGDEFVLVTENIDELQAINQLTSVFDRLHHCVEAPFEICPGVFVQVEMTMGVALFPLDAEDGDALIRQADAAMYQAKLHKHDRKCWWRIGASSDSSAEREDVFDVYGSEATSLLEGVQAQIKAVSEQFTEDFYADLKHTTSAYDILRHLTDDEMQTLRKQQIKHLQFLFAPKTGEQDVARRAGLLGTVHALVGVTPSLLVESSALYRRHLSDAVRTTAMPPRDRYRLLLTAESRLQDDVQVQLERQASVLAAYQDLLSRPLPAPGALWADVSAEEIAAMGRLPGMQGALLMRLTSSGVFVVERSAGGKGRAIAAILTTPGKEAVVDPQSPRGQGLSAVAWRSAEIQRAASYAKDPRYAAWHSQASALTIRSTLSVPVRNVAGIVVAVLSLFGAYPNQFESAAMQQFARGLQERWGQIWSRCTAVAPVVQEKQAKAIRERLFAGGLQMFMQPIVDLRNGSIPKVESLARLILEDGTILPPAQFLPLLGDTELDHVFRAGLNQALGQLVTWEAQGRPVNVSVNLAPTTLLDPDCSAWIEEALRDHGIAPHRLSLELLETETIDFAAQDEAIDRLTRLGIKLVMDDFGSGYSSLQRLSIVPFDAIKVDQSMVLGLRKSPLLNLSMIRAIIQLGHDLNREVILEGLEEAGMIEAAMILGASLGQGYGFARPMVAESLPSWCASFTLPITPGKVRTFLGALAHHWLHNQSVSTDLKIPLRTCPVAEFFEKRGVADSEPARWHAQCHGGGDIEAASQRLTDWLVEQVLAERP
ncbi:MAG: EAL domain-containing protein [Thiomonas sp.]